MGLYDSLNKYGDTTDINIYIYIQIQIHMQIFLYIYIYIYIYIYPQAAWFPVNVVASFGGVRGVGFEGANNVHPPVFLLCDSGWKCYVTTIFSRCKCYVTSVFSGWKCDVTSFFSRWKCHVTSFFKGWKCYVTSFFAGWKCYVTSFFSGWTCVIISFFSGWKCYVTSLFSGGGNATMTYEGQLSSWRALEISWCSCSILTFTDHSHDLQTDVFSSFWSHDWPEVKITVSFSTPLASPLRAYSVPNLPIKLCEGPANCTLCISTLIQWCMPKKGKARALTRSHAKRELQGRNRANDGASTCSKTHQIHPNSPNSRIDDSQNLRQFIRKHCSSQRKIWMDNAGVYIQ